MCHEWCKLKRQEDSNPLCPVLSILDRMIRNARDLIKTRPPMQDVDEYRTIVVIIYHYNSTYLLGDISIGSVLPLPLADCGDSELSRLLSPGLTRIFHLAVFLTSSLIPCCVPCNLPAISLAFCSPSLLLRRESERLGS